MKKQGESHLVHSMSRTIAELLEPLKSIEYGFIGWSPKLVWFASGVGADRVMTSLDFEHDPRGTDLAWKQMIRDEDYEQACRRIHQAASRYDLNDADDWNALVARAFLATHGVTVEE